MNYKMMGRFIAQTLTAVALLMIPAWLISLFSGETQAMWSLLATIAIAGGLILLLFGICRGAPNVFGAKEGLVCVAISWTVICLVGCLPFWFSRTIPSFIDAFFEIVSGFTTTGASILSDVEALPKGLLYWRSFSHWVGGMGVLVFLLAVAPGDSKGSGFTLHLLRAESPGPDVGKLVPKMRKTALILYIIYIVLTIANILFLLAGGMNLLDAACTAFGTAGTGGFGIRNDSFISLSPYLQNVTTVFMILFGINFSCYYLLLLRQIKGVFKDEELRLYLGIIFAAIVMICLNVRSYYGTWEETVRHASFQVASIITTTGYTSFDYDLWPAFSKGILMILMFIGACAGSTGGGLKCSRLLLITKVLRRNISKLLHPNRVQAIRINDRVVDEQVLDNANAYLSAYMILLAASFMIISLDNFSLGTNFSAVVTCFNNVGPGFELVGPTCNYSAYSPLSKLVLCFDMMAGRLELFPLLALFSRRTWRQR